MKTVFRQIFSISSIVLVLASITPAFATISTLIPCNAANNCQIYNVPVHSTDASVDIGNPTIQVQDWGNASAPNVILFIHGFPHAHNIWVEQIKGLNKNKYRVITMDARGQGNSFKPLCQLPSCDPSIGLNFMTGYHSMDFANDIDAIIHDPNLNILNLPNGGKKLFIVGHSYGGGIISDYINAYSANALSGIVFDASIVGPPANANPACAGFPFKGPGLLNNEQNLLSTDLSISIAATKAFLDASVFNVLLNFYAYPKEHEILATDSMVPPAVRLGLGGRTLFDLPSTAVYRTINKPVLLIHGANDQIILPSADACIASEIPITTPITTKLFYFTGHFSMFEQPDLFNKALTNFIDGIH